MEEKILAALVQFNGKFDTMQSGMAVQWHESHMVMTSVREALERLRTTLWGRLVSIGEAVANG